MKTQANKNHATIKLSSLNKNISLVEIYYSKIIAMSFEKVDTNRHQYQLCCNQYSQPLKPETIRAPVLINQVTSPKFSLFLFEEHSTGEDRSAPLQSFVQIL